MDDIPKSHFQQTVCLGDWWLVKAENDDGRRLAVSGFSSRKNQAMRVFSSAPILKRHDFFTLETTDGICVILKGFINKARTMENGFPSNVYNHFFLGFPPYWKEYDEKFMGGTSSCNFEVSGLRGPANEIKPSALDADSVRDGFRQISESPNQDKELRKVKTRGNKQKTKNKATRSLSTPAA
ncbi:hypothetical protein CDL12_07730 [Handroanthus impetiginosus]|uniref:SANTA domain-containing protein n=1 Tax=Handroanthus impetiginosus TaxID=429701 RepID=A0A2G9HPY8_9LAMI|nr:hypothetical protein CDL12_07730 [Handroanthus impetiginosus]